MPENGDAPMTQMPAGTTELLLPVPVDGLKSIRLLIDFGARHRGTTPAGGSVTLYSDLERS